jgi:hypothetical protein
MKRVISSAFVLGVGIALAPSPASPAEQAPCDAWEIDYTLAANLKLEDTPMGEGDGVYKIGPGRVTLRFEDRGGQPAGNVKMLAYGMKEHFQIVSKTLFWTTSVTTDTNTGVGQDRCSIVAEGVLTDRSLRWNKPLRGYHTDGTLTCDGSLCGKFGAPPSGTSALHIPPHDVPFAPFAYGADMKTFTMPFTFVSRSDMPKQTGYLALAARETRRACVVAKPCN